MKNLIEAIEKTLFLAEKSLQNSISTINIQNYNIRN